MSNLINIDIPGLEIQGFNISDSFLQADLNGVISGKINIIPTLYQQNLFINDFKTQIQLKEGIDKYFNSKNYIGTVKAKITQRNPYKIFTITVSYSPLSSGGRLGSIIIYNLFNRLPEELYLRILQYLPTDKIQLLCTNVGIMCNPSLWKDITLLGYGLSEHLRRIRTNKDPEIRDLKFNWESILTFLDTYMVYMIPGNTIIETVLNIASQTRNMNVLKLLIYGDSLFGKNAPNNYKRIGSKLLKTGLRDKDFNLVELLLKYPGIDVMDILHIPPVPIYNPFIEILSNKIIRDGYDIKKIKNIILLMLRALKNQINNFSEVFNDIIRYSMYMNLHEMSLDLLKKIYQIVLRE